MYVALMTIKKLIEKCGGAPAIVRAAREQGLSLSTMAVYKWTVNKMIPAKWHPLIVDLSKCTPEDIFRANHPDFDFEKKRIEEAA